MKTKNEQAGIAVIL